MTPAAGPRGDAPAAGWDHPDTARWYRWFEARHGRYRLANAALARHAAIGPGLRVLDLAAGTGGTAAALLPQLGTAGSVDCVEPAAAMRQAGQARLGAEPRVRWMADLDEAGADYDRIVCGAALWQRPDLPGLLARLVARLKPGGALCFNVPGAYVGVPDAPGGGSDPWLTALLARLTAGRPAQPAGTPPPAPPDARSISDLLAAAGLQARRWQQRQRLSQTAWADWLKIPVLSAPLWPHLPADERARRIDAALAEVDASSWRHETWLGWTAWRPAFAVEPLAEVPAHSPDRWAAQAQRDGCLLLRRLLPRRAVLALGARVRQAGHAAGLLDGRGHWAGPCAAAMHELPAWLALQAPVMLTPEFQALAQHPALRDAMARVLGTAPAGGQGGVVRLAPPDHRVAATPPHRDSEYLPGRRGLWVAWLPLSTCGPPQGVLALAPGSQHAAAPIRWAASSMSPGDVLLFSAETLHRACPNLQPRRVRLSLDLRFAPGSAAGGQGVEPAAP
jgi:SAM-dependent methyltransferase